MPFATVKLNPGVNTQYTKALNEAGVSVSNMIRYHDGLIQKIGGWTNYYSGTLGSTIVEIHAWQGLQSNKYLGVGTTGSSASGGTLNIINAGSLVDITPQTRTSNPAPNFTSSAGSRIITVIDDLSSASLFDSVYFNTPVAIGGTFLSGAYPINTVGGSTTWTILSSAAATSNVTSSGILPVFTTTANSASVSVVLPNNNYVKAVGLFYPFIAASSVGDITIQGAYALNTIVDSTTFTIITPTQASSAQTATMNGGLAQIVYYVAFGPPASGTGYGLGGYGLGGYGMGAGTTGSSGNSITTTDWSMDNWGEILLAIPKDGAVYQWAPDSGFTTATVIPQAPFFNGGLFISQPQQILVCWRSTQSSGVQDDLIVRWCDAGDFTTWTVSSQTTAGSFRIPTGSQIIGGIQAGTRGVIWTDIDCWVMQYVGGTVIFNFTRVGTGCGMIGPHAAGYMGEVVFWMGQNNFYIMSDQGVKTLPCSVWDYVFQNINKTYKNKVRCAVNSMFDEVTWYFPSTTSAGLNDSYVRYNATEQEWDYGTLSRTAWADQSALGNPIGTDATNIYKHEDGNDNTSVPITPTFESGYWTIAEGEQMAFVDFLIPDMKFGLYGSSPTASCEVTLKALDYEGDTPRTYGPFTFTSTTQYLNPRLRGRFMSITIDSNDLGSFWRIGAVKYRWNSAGRR